MKSKLPYILEIIWLLMMIGSTTLAVYRTMQTSFSDNIVLYIIAVLSALMYSSRRYVRKTKEKINSQK